MRRSRAIETTQRLSVDEMDHRQTISVSPVATGSSSSADISSLPSPTTQRSPRPSSSHQQRKNKNIARRQRPPLSKHPKSVVSDATNSTYLSSDSEEDSTIRSGDLSAISGNSNNGGSSGIAARRSTRRHRSESTTSRGGPKKKSTSTRLVTLEDGPESNSSGSSSDVADFLLQYSDNEDEMYPPQLVSDDSEGLQLEEDDDFLQLINERSNHWRQAVSETIQKTSTATTCVAGNLMMGGYNNNVNNSHQQQQHHPKKQNLLQEQKAEIQALQAQLEQQHITGVPLAQIEVSATSTSDVDDLTIWSSDCFQPVKRPDAASVVSKPPSPKSTTRAFTMNFHNGKSVSAVFTGNLTRDLEGDYAGVGMIRFANGDVYQGEMRHSQLHGKGSYTDAKSKVVRKGRFESGAFVGTV